MTDDQEQRPAIITTNEPWDPADNYQPPWIQTDETYERVIRNLNAPTTGRWLLVHVKGRRMVININNIISISEGYLNA